MKVGIVGDIHPSGYDFFDKNNIEYFVTNNIEENNLTKELSDVDGIIIRTAELNENILSKSQNLKIVARHGVGYDNVDTEYLNKNKIAMAITGRANAVSVAEHVMTMMLNLTKNISKSDKLIRDNKFKEKANLPNFFELYNKKILIMGFGRIGKALAKRCLGFDMEIFVHDPFINENEITSNNCIPINKDEGFKIADYISIHLPLNDKTKNLISSNEFKIFKSNLILINTARGGIINEDDLFDALNNNRIFGAGIDVFEQEPPINDHKLFSLENIILTPHNAALTLECRKRMAIECCENVFNFLSKNKNLIESNIINLDILS
jgi:D-3-phosphoglycerate dehydrogenase